MKSVLNVHWKDWCWSWNSSTSATSREDLTHWKRLWCWEGLGAGGEGDDKGWDGWMASPPRWTWVWINSGSWWWTGRPGMLLSMGSQRVGHNWVTELNWSEPCFTSLIIFIFHKTPNPSLIIRQSQKSSSWKAYKILGQWKSPGSLVVRIPGCHAVSQAQSMVQELRSHKLCDTTKK